MHCFKEPLQFHGSWMGCINAAGHRAVAAWRAVLDVDLHVCRCLRAAGEVSGLSAVEVSFWLIFVSAHQVFYLDLVIASSAHPWEIRLLMAPASRATHCLTRNPWIRHFSVLFFILRIALGELNRLKHFIIKRLERGVLFLIDFSSHRVRIIVQDVPGAAVGNVVGHVY